MKNEKILEKIIKMFSPYGDGKFLDFNGEEVICGPNDRSIVGFDNNFPKDWLIEDFGFDPEEADWFISEVKRLNQT